jgi:serine/threonine-protein kinase RsbW
MSHGPEILLRLPAEAQNVALVRQALSGIGESLAVERSLLADMKTAVTEACNNVVLHAYPGTEGEMEVAATPSDGHLEITVRDHGGGMQPRSVEPEEPSLGLGLPLIAALSDTFELHGGRGRGVEVKMMFLISPEREATEAEQGDDAVVTLAERQPPSAPAEANYAGVTITPGPLLAPVLGRLAAMLAARVDFSLDRLSDTVLVTDAIAAHVSPYIPGSQASIVFEERDGELALRVGPLVGGGAKEVLRRLELPGLGKSLEQLADDVKVERGSVDGDSEEADEYLLLSLTRES